MCTIKTDQVCLMRKGALLRPGRQFGVVQEDGSGSNFSFALSETHERRQVSLCLYNLVSSSVNWRL